MIPPDVLNEEGLYHLQWWVDGERVDERFVTETSDGFLFLCQDCGYDKPWAAKYFPNRALTKFYSACRNHPPLRGEVPGSLVLWFHDELERMPAVLVEREYLIHLAHYERECHERDTLERQAA